MDQGAIRPNEISHVTVEQVSTERSTTGYYERKAAGLCTYYRCSSESTDDSVLCAKHLEAQRARKRQSQNALRTQRRADGKCPGCGLVETDDYLCSRCRVLQRRTKRARRGVEHKTEHNAAGWRQDMEQSPDGVVRARNRYHGQGKRGRQPIAALDAQDLADARRCIETGVRQLADADKPEIKALPRIQRDEETAAALSCIQRARRWLNEVLERHGVEDEQIVDSDEDGE